MNSVKKLARVLRSISDIEVRCNDKCWKCGSKLVYRSQKLYCEKCRKVRKFLWKNPVKIFDEMENF